MDVIQRTGSELQEARHAARERFLSVANALKMEAGVTAHKVRKALSGMAWPDGHIDAPEGATRKQLYILAHECAHVALGHVSVKGKARKPRHVEEMEAERWAHEALRHHGIAVPRAMTVRAKQYVARKIRQAEARGAKHIDAAARKYSEL